MPRALRVAALLLGVVAVSEASVILCATMANAPGGLCTPGGGCPFSTCPLLDGEPTCAPELLAGAPCDEENPAAGVCGAGLLCGEDGVGVCLGGAAEGEACDSSAGGVKCGAGLVCAREGLAASEQCRAAAADGDACGDYAGGAVCTAVWPAVAKCVSGRCQIDSSAVPPCDAGRQAVQVRAGRDRQEVAVCVSWQQQAGERCQVAAPLGSPYLEFQCAEGSGLVCRKLPGTGRYDAEGTCVTVGYR